MVQGLGLVPHSRLRLRNYRIHIYPLEMANTSEILLTYRTDTKEVTKSFDEIVQGLEGVDRKTAETAKKTEKIGDSAKKAGKTGASGFKILDVALKSTGILFIVSKFIEFAAVMLENKRVAEALEVVMAGIGVVMNQIYEAIEPLGDVIIEAFQNPVETIKSLGDTIKQNIINRFEGLLEFIPAIGKAIKLVFAGEWKEAGKVAADAAGKVVLGVEDITDKVADAAEAVVEFGTKFVEKTKKAVQESNALTRSQQNLRKAIQDLDVTQAQTLARIEEIKRARDDEGNSIDERIRKATEAAELDQRFADQRLSIANQDVAQIEEEIRLQGLTLEREQQLADARMKAAEAARESAGVQIELTEFITNAEQARVDLEDELYQKSLLFYDAEEQALLNAYDKRIAIAGDDEGLVKKATEDLNRDLAEINQKYRDVEIQAKFDMAKQGFAALSALSTAFAGTEEKNAERQFKIQKALSLASATVSSTEAVINAYKTAQGSPITLLNPAYPAIQAALAAAFGVAQITTIARSQFQSPALPDAGGGGGGGGGGGSTNIPRSPQLDLGFLGEGAGQTGFRSYVIASEVSNSQQANQRINDQASLVG